MTLSSLDLIKLSQKSSIYDYSRTLYINTHILQKVKKELGTSSSKMRPVLPFACAMFEDHCTIVADHL